MEFLILLGLMIPIGVACLIFWPKSHPPDYDWKSCVKRLEEEEKRRKQRIEKDKRRVENLVWNPATGDAVSGGGVDINGNPVL